MNIKEKAQQMKLASPKLAAACVEDRNKALQMIAEELNKRFDEISAENEKDLRKAKETGISDAIIKRLKFGKDKLESVISGIEQLISLPDPLGKITLNRDLDDGLNLKRITCPIGVIGVIFEARPDALVQISTLCIKSGNCAILKGGKETANTNRILFSIIHETAVKAGLPKEAYVQAEQHDEIDELLKCHEYVDLLIPRGSNAFVKYIMDNTKIPVMGHADGVCHIYIDDHCDCCPKHSGEDVKCPYGSIAPIIIDAKTQYCAACNAVETLLVNRKVAEKLLPKLAKELKEAHVKIRGTKEVADIIEAEEIADDDFRNEYLDFIISVKLVNSVDEAIEHINKYGSHHTDAILSNDENNIRKFMTLVDSAGVYANCSTRFADGFRYGFGAEVGISTGKIHARGPVGLEGLVTYKYCLEGHGQIVGDYASGKAQFKFKDL